MTAAIGATAPITLITGLPGSGKTLRAVKFIRDAVDAGEVIFVCNLNGLKLPHVPFEDPRKWRELPAGSVLVVDEAQQFFRTARGEAPEYITAMETIRHQGVRLILLTQQPDYLLSHLRGLVGLHEHLLRVEGKPQAKIWRHNEVMDNVRSERARARYDTETWDYDPSLYPLYESAQVHTVKRVMSSRWKRGLTWLALAGVVGIFVAWKFAGFFSFGGDVQAAALDPTADGRAAVAGGEPASAAITATPGREAHTPQAVAEFVMRHQPRLPSLPWSAPIYDGRAVVSQPRVFCMDAGAGQTASGHQVGEGVTCVTEQGSRHVMPDWQAKLLAREGEPYNPYKAPREEHQAFGYEREQQPATGAGAPAVVAIGEKAQVPRYGQFRDDPLGPERYEVQGW